MAFTHERGFKLPEGKTLLKSHFTRSEKGIQLLFEAVRKLALEFSRRYGFGGAGG